MVFGFGSALSRGICQPAPTFTEIHRRPGSQTGTVARFGREAQSACEDIAQARSTGTPIATIACPGEVESGLPIRTCVNRRIYGVSRSYGITE